MGWIQCSMCGRYYDSTKGGCKNPYCKMFDGSGRKAAPPIPPLTKFPHPAPPRPMVPHPELPHKVLPVAKAQPKVVPLAAAFTLNLYRGEKSQWWPPPEKRLACGMSIYSPWKGNMDHLWELLIKDIRANGGNTKAYAQYLRAGGKDYALATARTREGAFGSDYNYELEIKNVRTFQWRPDLTIGDPLPFTSPIEADYIVLNAPDVSHSSVLGFGHKTGTYEVTLFKPLPIECVLSCNGEKVKDGKVGGRRILTKQEAQKLMPNDDEDKYARKLAWAA